jgi:hypothetical protein
MSTPTSRSWRDGIRIPKVNLRRWAPVNRLKNSSVTIQIVVSVSGKTFIVPDITTTTTTSELSSKNQLPPLLGSTSLTELVQRVKKDNPALYLCDEAGSNVLACGPNMIYQHDWSTKMICDLIHERKGLGGRAVGVAIPRIVLEDGREAVVVTIGTPEAVLNTGPSVIHRCLAKGDVYG